MLNEYSTTIITGIPDRTTFLEWQRLAAEGDPAALNSLGAAYLNGWHVSVNPEEGVQLMRIAADKGNLKARTNMGGFMVTGTYLPQDQCGGVSLVKGAAEEGFPPAMARLGSYYWMGIVSILSKPSNGFVVLQNRMILEPISP